MKSHRFTAVIVVAAVSGGAALPVALADAAGQGTPILKAGTYHGRRPSGIPLSGDGGNIVTGLKWRHWGRTYAYGVGTSDVLSCVPDCASGSATPERTTITFSRPRDGHWTRLKEVRGGHKLIGHYGGLWPIDAN